MELTDIKIGQFFTIDNTKSYPKLRNEEGYIDVRDEIKITADNIPFEIEVMTDEQVLEEFKKYGYKELSEILNLKKELLNN